jgi:anaerobic magnesium-protoporphyrin IX monomethyl ester cyclase
MKVMLAFPPQFDVTMPHLALPCLTAALREAGHEVVQKDVNIESYDILLNKVELERAYFKLCMEWKNLLFAGVNVNELESVIGSGKYLINEIENAKNSIRESDDFYNYKKYTENYNIIKSALRLLSYAYYPAMLTLNSYTAGYSATSIEQIMSAVKDEDVNLYIDFYRKYTLKDIIKEAPKVFGISISTESQVIPGLTLAYMVKMELKDVHIVIGGAYFSRLREEITESIELFSLFDSVLLNEGETSLIKLIDCIGQGIPLSSVPNLIYKFNSKVVSTGISYSENVSELPTPCFDGLPLNLYFTHELVLPVYGGRGCYWGNCAFCSFYFSAGNKYRFRGAEKIIEDIKKLMQKYDCRIFTFIDEAIPPNYLVQIADTLLKNEMDVKWATHTRFEKQYNYEVFKKLSTGGCRGLAFGLESSCNRLLKLMDKGTDIDTIKSVLKASSEAGILNHISFFIGFPSETFCEAMGSIDFVTGNINYIDSISFEYFRLMKGSKMIKDLDKYGIKQICKNDDDALSVEFAYDINVGLTQKDAKVIYKKAIGMFLDLCPSLNINGSNVLLFSAFYYDFGLIKAISLESKNGMNKQEFAAWRLSNAKLRLDDFRRSMEVTR